MLATPTLRAALSGALAFVFTLVAPASAVGANLRFVKRDWGTGEVHLVDGNREELLERYPEPISVHAAEVSLDGHWAFVWHYKARPPLELAIYDLRAMKRTAQFAPGFGGEMHFTPRGHIAHFWGCGTNCAEFMLYDVTGKKLLGAWSSGIELSPSRRFAVSGPSLFASDEAVVVYDLDAARRFVVEPPARHSDSFILEAVRWDERGGAISMAVRRLHGGHHNIVFHAP